MNILAGVPLGIKIVGGIVATATAVAVPTAIILTNNADSTPEASQSSTIQQHKTPEEKPVEKDTTVKAEIKEEVPIVTQKPTKVKPVASTKVEQPAPKPTPAPTPTRDELMAKAIAEFKTTNFMGKVTGKDFLDKLRETYLRNPHPSYLEKVYPQGYMNTNFIAFAKILKKYGIVEEENAHTGYIHILELIKTGNY